MMRAFLITVVRLYRLLLSPWLGSSCRFEPTCSAYALQALALHGAAHGSYLAARRILRCNPWCQGGCDPVPAPRHKPHQQPIFSSLLPPSSPPGPSAPSSSLTDSASHTP